MTTWRNNFNAPQDLPEDPAAYIAELEKTLDQARTVIKQGLGWDDDEASVELVEKIDEVLG